MDASRSTFSGDPCIAFAKRDITRPHSAGGEDHRAVSVVDFEEGLAAGRYPLHWDAHHLRYGVGADELAPLTEGVSVVLNGSRSVIDDACHQFPETRVISIRVGQDILAERLENRGRETSDMVARRLARASAFDVAGPHVEEIWNEGTVEEGCAAFCDAIRRALT